MRAADISGLSVSDLRVLATLLEERHVSRAAARVHLSQPAMSRALQRLRRVFGDELLVRGEGRYRLTPQAERIERDLPLLLSRLNALADGTDFDPATASASFRITGTDYIARIFAPLLLPEIVGRSPGSTLSFMPWHDRVDDDLQRGRSDLAIRAVQVREGLRSEELFTDRYVCLMAPDHDFAGVKRLSLKRYLGCRHVAVDLAEGRQTTLDERLAARNIARDVALHVPYHDAAIAAARATGLIATVPLGLAPADLPIVAAPKEIEQLTFRIVWHPRLDAEPAHRWLRDLLRSVAPGAAPARSQASKIEAI